MFKEVLAQAYRARLRERAPHPTVAFAGRMYDLCKNEYATKKKIDLFCKVDGRLDLFSVVADREESADSLIARYDEVSDLLSKGAFRELVILVKEIADKQGECYYPQQPIPAGSPQQPTPTEGKSAKRRPRAQGACHPPAASPRRVANPHPSAPPAPLPNPLPRSVLPAQKKRMLFLLIPLSILLVTGIVLLSVFGRRIAWWQWQHIIGAFVGATSVGGVIKFASVKCYDSEEGTFLLLVVLGVLAAVNIPLVFVYKEGYSTIFYWLSGYAIVSALGMALYDFGDFEEGLGGGCIVVASLLFFTVLMYLFGHAWWQWQHFIGSIGGLFIVGGGFLILILLLEDDFCFPGVFLFGFFLILNIVFAVIFKGNYRIISFWISGYLILACGLTSFSAFDDGEGAFGFVSLVEALIAVGSIIGIAMLT